MSCYSLLLLLWVCVCHSCFSQSDRHGLCQCIYLGDSCSSPMTKIKPPLPYEDCKYPEESLSLRLHSPSLIYSFHCITTSIVLWKLYFLYFQLHIDSKALSISLLQTLGTASRKQWTFNIYILCVCFCVCVSLSLSHAHYFSLCVSVCMCMYVCLCVYVCLYMYVCVCMCVYVAVYVCIHVSISLCVYVWKPHACGYMCVHIHVEVRRQLWVSFSGAIYHIFKNKISFYSLEPARLTDQQVSGLALCHPA